MLVSERSLETAIREFFHEMKIPRPSHWSKNMDYLFLKKAVPSFILALEKIEPIDFCYGFDADNVIRID